MGEEEGKACMDLALKTSLLGVKTLHSMAEVPDNMTKASGWEQEVAVLGMTVDARAGETLTANRLNGRFQSRLRSLYNLCPHYPLLLSQQ